MSGENEHAFNDHKQAKPFLQTHLFMERVPRKMQATGAYRAHKK
jgi:hypothetical protein